jgi:hypothetical protein
MERVKTQTFGTETEEVKTLSEIDVWIYVKTKAFGTKNHLHKCHMKMHELSKEIKTLQ